MKSSHSEQLGIIIIIIIILIIVTYHQFLRSVHVHLHLGAGLHQAVEGAGLGGAHQTLVIEDDEL